MSNTEQLQELADFLWELLTDQPPTAEEQQQQLTDRLIDALEEGGFCLLYTSPSPRDRG